MWWRRIKQSDAGGDLRPCFDRKQRERQSILTQREFADRYCALHKLAVHRVYASQSQFQLERMFRPEDTDIDDLAEAIRLLLGGGDRLHGHRASNLPLEAKRVSHVVEGTSST